MRKIAFSLILAAIASCSVAQEKKLAFTVSGHISPELADSISKVFLYYYDDGENHADSTGLVKGKFVFKGEVRELTQATLVARFRQLSSLENRLRGITESRKIYLGEGKMEVRIDDRFRNAVVTGSPMTVDADLYDAYLAPFLDNNERVYQQTRTEPPGKARTAKRRAASQAIVTAKKDFIRKYPNHPFAIHAMKDVLQDYQNDKLFKPGADAVYAELVSLNDRLGPKLKGTPEGKDFDKRLKELSTRKLPHFSGPSLAGGTIDINSYKGRVFLIDFWGSWCVWCRKGHPHLKEVYEKFRPLGFEIIGVGVEFDKDRKVGEQKLRDAIAKDGITWPQIFNVNDGDADLRKIFSIYAYPTKILVDQSGNIVLRVTDDEERKLDAKLEELLGKKQGTSPGP